MIKCLTKTTRNEIRTNETRFGDVTQLSFILYNRYDKYACNESALTEKSKFKHCVTY